MSEHTGPEDEPPQAGEKFSVSIHVADLNRGGAYTHSQLDQMWYELSDGKGPAASFGLVHDVERQGQPFAIGQISFMDRPAMQKRIYSRTVEVSREEYDAMQNFAFNPTAAGFDMHYVGPKNRGVAFTWKAMELAGMNPAGYDD
jgi:hypothetical protein